MSRNRIPKMEELVGGPVVRQHIESEWMSKLTASQYRAWEDFERELMESRMVPKFMLEDELKQQIKYKELEYKITKERLLKPITINEKIQLGGELHTNDLVISPSTRDALITTTVTGTTKTNNNGRKYPKHAFDLTVGRQVYNTDWQHGEYNSNVIRVDKYKRPN